MSIVPNPDTDPIIGVTLAASIAGVDKMTAYRFLQSGEWPAVQVGKKWAINTRKFLDLYGLLDEAQTHPAGAEAESSGV